MTYNVKIAAENIKTIELLVEFQSPFSEVFGIPVPKTSRIDDLKDLIAISIGEGKKHIPIQVTFDRVDSNFQRGQSKVWQRQPPLMVTVKKKLSLRSWPIEEHMVWIYIVFTFCLLEL